MLCMEDRGPRSPRDVVHGPDGSSESGSALEFSHIVSRSALMRRGKSSQVSTLTHRCALFVLLVGHILN